MQPPQLAVVAALLSAAAAAAAAPAHNVHHFGLADLNGGVAVDGTSAKLSSSGLADSALNKVKAAAAALGARQDNAGDTKIKVDAGEAVTELSGSANSVESEVSTLTKRSGTAVIGELPARRGESDGSSPGPTALGSALKAVIGPDATSNVLTPVFSTVFPPRDGKDAARLNKRQNEAGLAGVESAVAPLTGIVGSATSLIGVNSNNVDSLRNPLSGGASKSVPGSNTAEGGLGLADSIVKGILRKDTGEVEKGEPAGLSERGLPPNTLTGDTGLGGLASSIIESVTGTVNAREFDPAAIVDDVYSTVFGSSRIPTVVVSTNGPFVNPAALPDLPVLGSATGQLDRRGDPLFIDVGSNKDGSLGAGIQNSGGSSLAKVDVDSSVINEGAANAVGANTDGSALVSADASSAALGGVASESNSLTNVLSGSEGITGLTKRDLIDGASTVTAGVSPSNPNVGAGALVGGPAVVGPNGVATVDPVGIPGVPAPGIVGSALDLAGGIVASTLGDASGTTGAATVPASSELGANGALGASGEGILPDGTSSSGALGGQLGGPGGLTGSGSISGSAGGSVGGSHSGSGSLSGSLVGSSSGFRAVGGGSVTAARRSIAGAGDQLGARDEEPSSLPAALQNCCYARYSNGGFACADGSAPTPFCGIQACNAFGCDCECR